MRAYIHIDADGSYQGNGGFLTLALLALKMGHLGYDVGVFDAQDRLHARLFDWLDLPDMPFQIVPFDDVVADNASIITSWLRSWQDILARHPSMWPRLIYWCHDELLRTDSEPARAFVREQLAGIAITNGALKPFYERLGLTVQHILPLWIRHDFSPAPPRRVIGRIGYQPDRGGDARLADLQSSFGSANVLACNGTQREVGHAMQTCDIFVSWNNAKNLPFAGEGFGLALYESAACGCAPVFKSHMGNSSMMPAALSFPPDTWKEAVKRVKAMRSNNEMVDAMRAQSLRVIEKYYRWDNRRADTIAAMVRDINNGNKS